VTCRKRLLGFREAFASHRSEGNLGVALKERGRSAATMSIDIENLVADVQRLL